MAVTVAEFNEVKSDVSRHDQFINGNGTKGAKERLTLIENTLERLDHNINKAVNWIVGLAITVIGAVIIWFFTTILPKIVSMI
jgi:hypothetical protein